MRENLSTEIERVILVKSQMAEQEKGKYFWVGKGMVGRKGAEGKQGWQRAHI